MRRWLLGLILFGGAAAGLGAGPAAGDKTAVERGRDALYHHAFNPPFWTEKAYAEAWRQWGAAAKPADYDAAFRQRYGLHLAPYDNRGLPLGLVPARSLFGKGLTQNCLMCHAGSLFGQTVLGLGNNALDVQALFDELFAADGILKPVLPFQLSYARGTIDPITPVTFFMQFRDAELNLQKPIHLELRNDSCSRPPAWWQLKKKRTRDWTGAIDAHSDRVDMAFLLNPLNSAATIKKQEPIFADIRAFVLSVQPPKYPFPVDAAKAAKGRGIFEEHCSRCHGTYGPQGKYPNKVVDVDTIDTDRTLAESTPPGALEHYNKSWFARQIGPDGAAYRAIEPLGYQAPPLDGVWATAPYFHNASVPTIYQVLNSTARPKYFTRGYRTGREDYDPRRVGWKYTELGGPADAKLPSFERRKIYDTTLPGRGNGGHRFGDKLKDAERWAVIEYLKTL
jgi:mono/diheme cytochrome c family protein